MDAQEIIKTLGLHPLQGEGGFYRETYRSAESLSKGSLPSRYRSGRSLSTAIYYLLTSDTFSAIHRIESDEVFHFYLGDPVTMIQLYPDRSAKEIIMGSNLLSGQVPQCMVPRGVWQGACLKPGGHFALMGTTVAPGFDFQDFELGERQALLDEFPKHADWILRLTR